MRVAIIGDSFTQSYKDTYLEKICLENNLILLDQIGFAGQSQYKIYKHFLNILESSPDVIICAHTEYSRLYHPIQSISPHIDQLTLNKEANPKIVEAAKQYYEYLYDDEYAKSMYIMLIDKMQQICREKNIKLINFPAFENLFINKTYGLWFVSASGLLGLSRADMPNWNPNIPDKRLNHFTENGHRVLAEQTIPHIKTYINGNQELHMVSLYSDYFTT